MKMKLALLLLLSAALGATLGCAAHHVKQITPKPPEVWVLKTCAQNGDRFVCECTQSYEEIEAETGRRIKVCK
jgi:hypothetical protein